MPKPSPVTHLFPPKARAADPLPSSRTTSRFARRQVRLRAACFQLSDEARACLVKGAARFRHPRVVLYENRRDHNRRMHALNGNGVAPLPVPAARPRAALSRRQRNRLAHALNGNSPAGDGSVRGVSACPADTAGSPALHGFTLLGMRLANERSDCFTELSSCLRKLRAPAYSAHRR